MNAHDLEETKHYLPTGLLLIILGLIAVSSPAMAGTAVVMVIGVVLLGAGVIEVAQGIRDHSWKNRVPSLVFGVITAVCGLGVLGHPLLGLKFLTLLLSVYFVAGGIAKILGSFCFRPISGWLLMLGSGMISLLLGVIIWRQWPVSGLWAVGLLVGIDLLLTGSSMVVLATTVRRQHGLAAGTGTV